ncbi:MAG: hypothetical protein A2W22_02245 [Candidatus Levybacteria bacterium RBG_16_35_11]|nr:MAG: hypothetical protein A2W22_02245 [Candidatus Levybacteria bacterium RBG_16_35_11]
MRKILFITFITTIIFLIFFQETLFAQTTTPTSSISQELQQKLLNQIASKAAQLKLTEKRGIIGTVKEAKDTSITLVDTTGNTRFVDVDELTEFSSSSKSFGISDIEKGMVLGVLGLYNKDSRRLLARDISTLTLPTVVSGQVSEIDKENFQLYILTEKDRVKIDVQDITRTYSYLEDELSLSGFSKITQEVTIVAIGYPDSTDKEMILAQRIIIFPNIPKNPKIISKPNILDNSVTIPPSTGSGLKIQPITE